MSSRSKKKDFNTALKYSFLLLKYRPRSINEIRQRLKKKGYPDDIIDKLVDYLREHRYVDDYDFVLSFIRDRTRKGFGWRRIEYELLTKFGINNELLEDVLPVIKKEIDFTDNIRKLVKKKLRLGKDRRSILRYLLQRGFSYEETSDVINDIMRTQSSETS